MIQQLRTNTRTQMRLKMKLPAIVQELVTEFPLFLAGGALSHILNGLPFGDYDLFYIGPDKTFSDTVVEIQMKYFKHFKTWNAHNDCHTFELSGVKIQLIRLNEPTAPREILEAFDLLPCRIGWDGMHLWSDRLSLRSCLKKEIRFSRIEYPLVAFKRFLKYRDKGYTATDEQIKEFLDQVHVRLLTYNLTDDSVTRESLWRPYIVETRQ